MDVHNSVTYVGFNTGVIISAAVIILISLLVIFLLIRKNCSDYILCGKSTGVSMYNIITVSFFCGIFFKFGSVVDFSEYKFSDISIIVSGASVFLFYFTICYIITAITKVLCKFIYKIFKKIRR